MGDQSGVDGCVGAADVLPIACRQALLLCGAARAVMCSDEGNQKP